jgi:hypothetical protein
MRPDVLGDVLKIKQAKGYHTYLFVVTDGRGWFNRQSDLTRLVELHVNGTVEMIYTRARLAQRQRTCADMGDGAVTGQSGR